MVEMNKLKLWWKLFVEKHIVSEYPFEGEL